MAWLEQFGGGFRDDYDFTIQLAYFAPDAAYQDGSTFLLTLVGIDENGEPVTEKYNAAKTLEWSSFDGGKTIQPTGKVKQLNKSSVYAHLCEAAINCGAGDTLASRGEATNSQCWVGLKFHMKSTKIEFGKKIDPIERNLPVQFLGLDDETVAKVFTLPQQQTFTAPAPVAAPAAPVAPAPATAASPAVVELQALAQASPDHKTFMSKALYVEGVMGDDDLLSSITDPDGFYKTHHTA